MSTDLTIRELFPPDDLVGHWVFTLAATTADLSVEPWDSQAFWDARRGRSAAVPRPEGHRLRPAPCNLPKRLTFPL